MNLIYFDLLSTDITADVDMKVNAIGINVIGNYKILFATAGLSQWRSSVDISLPDNATSVLFSDSGYGYHYGAGIQLELGQHW